MTSEQNDQRKKNKSLEMNSFLSIYEFKIAGIIPAYHTEIAIGENSYGYGDDGLEITRETNLNGRFGYKLITSIPLGRTPKSQREIAEIIIEMDQAWPAESYDLFKKNCRHFSLSLLNKIECDSSAEGRRILAGLIEFSEKVGWVISLLLAGFIRSLSLSPLILVARPLEMFNRGRILELDYDFKIQLLQVLLAANGFWFLFVVLASLLSKSRDHDNEMIEQFENMEL